ncbi:hypothetical protein C2S51_021202 [Perilla frutescens var. frutescens]|nr:hypothetical protein C2S51_021202 [Perilla frutescens var. frutescens]
MQLKPKRKNHNRSSTSASISRDRRGKNRRREPWHHRRRQPSYRIQISRHFHRLGFATTAKSESTPPLRNLEAKVDQNFNCKSELDLDSSKLRIKKMDEQAILADNELDIVILDKSGDEHHEYTDENEDNITLIEAVNTFDVSGSLIGFKRESFEEMYQLYCLHAQEVGFSVRKNTQMRNSTGAVTEKYYVCSSEGVKNITEIVPLSNQEKKWTWRRNITRTNCKASLRVRRGQDGLLEVIEHVQEHNHELSRKEWSQDISVLDPQRTTTNGRKKMIKGQLEKGKKKTNNAASSTQLNEFGSKTLNPQVF